MQKLKEQQAIRLANTLLAAAGGAVLSFTLLYAYYAQALLVPDHFLWLFLTLFWLGNGLIIGVIASGFNLRFRDPALSLLQMYWAATVSVLALLFSSRVDIAIYLLLMLTLVFGIFRVSIRHFYIIAVYVIVFILIMHGVRWAFLETTAELSLVLVQWATFTFCTLTFTHLCKSILTLRNRLRQRNEQLQEALEAKQQFLANMSHEIRTPMNGVLGMLDILLRDDMPPKQRRYLGIAHSSAVSLLTVINDILDFSRMEAGKLQVESIAVDVGKLVVDVMTTFSADAESRGIELILDMSSEMPSTVVVDPVRLRQILNNLLGNALKFTEKGEVTVNVKLQANGEDQHLSVQVCDTGIGIDESASLDALFESFTQADASTTRTYGGTGLGLTICKQLCLLMGGDISVTSEYRVGSCFEFWLPVKSVPDLDDLADTIEAVANAHILLVDDNSASLGVLQKQLQWTGATVTAAQSAAVALTLCTEVQVDLVIVDMQMPEMDGLALAQAIHQKLGRQFTLLVLTSTMADVNEETLQPLGIAAAYMHKPILPKRLYKAIAHILIASSDRSVSPLLESEDKNTAPTSVNPLAQRRVLLVEDNATNREVAAVTLAEMGYSVDLANDGSEAVSIVEKALAEGLIYDVILMDCQMPVLDGYQATQQIRQLPKPSRYPYLPIVAMTANAMRGDREKCLAAGMDDYIIKPFEFDAVQQKLAMWTSGQSEGMALTEASGGRVVSTAELNEPVWDQEALRKLVGNNEQRIRQLLLPFVEGLVTFEAEILASLEQRDLEKAEERVHCLKGTSANVGARALPAFLRQLEGQLKAGLGESDYPAVSQSLSRHIVALKKVLNDFLGR